MSNVIKLKCTYNINYFIVIILPYIELFIAENPESVIIFFANDIICTILNVMFKNNIKTQLIKHGFDIISSNSPIIETDNFFKMIYGEESLRSTEDSFVKITRPLRYGVNLHLKSRVFTCIYPKCIQLDTFGGMTHSMLDELYSSTLMGKNNVYAIGDITERLNLKYGTDVENLFDTFDYLKYCNIFITSESYWKHIALLCGCRNIIVYNSSKQRIDELNYNPFNCNITYTDNLNAPEVYEIINKSFTYKK